MSKTFQEKVVEIQQDLLQQQVDGWLIFDFAGSNQIAHTILNMPEKHACTRRFFYWIPQKGVPVKLVHAVEATILDALPGEKKIYADWRFLHESLQKWIRPGVKVLMEYFPQGRIPYLSQVDAGTVDLIRNLGGEVFSSATFLQKHFQSLTQEQITLHCEAAHILERTVKKAFDWIGAQLSQYHPISEWDVQQYILDIVQSEDCIAEDLPIVAVQAHSADPHYRVTQKNASLIRSGDFILIDVSCKKNALYSCYADICRVAVAAPHPSCRQQTIFDIVYHAQTRTVAWICDQLATQKEIRGCDVDRVCRCYIENQGYGPYFTHRTGHSIDTQNHGSGVNLDSLETEDTRLLLPGALFSIEPGIYLPQELGVRLEHDAYIDEKYRLHITGGIQNQIYCLVK